MIKLIVATMTASLATGYQCTGDWCPSPEGPAQACEDDAGPPWADDREHFPGKHYYDDTPATPILPSSGECPAPLSAACAAKGVKPAFLDGPINCGGAGCVHRLGLAVVLWNAAAVDIHHSMLSSCIRLSRAQLVLPDHATGGLAQRPGGPRVWRQELWALQRDRCGRG